MTLLTTDRRAVTDAPILDQLAVRWSPRSFDREAQLSEEQITSLLEAARWAPSAANFQPRRFVVARRGSDAFDRITASLAGGNQPWAQHASLYVVAVALTTDPDGNPYRWADYDAGQALAHLAVQAHALDLHVHTMGGFDGAAIKEHFHLPENGEVVSVTAVGVVADADLLPDRYRDRELAARTRLPLAELVLVNE